MTDFTELPDLACEAVGGAAILCNDEFFAEKENLVKPDAAVWKDHLYTDRGKWMDGWETRRYRPADGVAPGRDSDVHDWCVVRLGLPGVIRGVVVDTAWFRGNYPDTCALEGAAIDDPLDLAALDRAAWAPLLPRAPLQGDSKNRFELTHPGRVTHVRLRIYPDGGVARLRVHGEVAPRWDRLRAGGLVDLAALEHGGLVETCSDMFFGSRNNLIKPGPSRTMADGWETRRRRGPGHEWAIVRLAAPGTIERLELDTSHFKGNAPARARVEVVHQPGAAAGELSGWRTLLDTATQAHTRHVFDAELRRVGVASHLRLSVFPCGGVARLRAWGSLAPDPADVGGLARLGMLPVEEAVDALRRCCGSRAWARAVADQRPFADAPALLRAAEDAWWALPEEAWLEAFAAHPAIGARAPHDAATAAWSSDEQRAVAEAAQAVTDELERLNRDYLARFGFLFIVCAQGRPAASMLAELRARVSRGRAEELRAAAEEQMQITRLRLRKLIGALS